MALGNEARELWGFLERLYANPRDVEHRKVFADWLEECDEPELADLQRNFDLAKYDAEQRLRGAAERIYEGDYDGMLAGLLDGQICFADDDYGGYVNDPEFWKDVEVVSGTKLPEDHRENGSFRCAC